ncbi:MAG: hypothetical protein AAF938_16435, partial [Myxococcota bacterium]
DRTPRAGVEVGRGFARRIGPEGNHRREMRMAVDDEAHVLALRDLFGAGTWRTVHQIGNVLPGRPTFLPYDAMSYLVFFPTGDPLGRDYEWWTGAMVPR